MDKYSFLNAAHAAFFEDLYNQYLQNPDSVEPSWRAFFQGYDFGQEDYGLSTTNPTPLQPTAGESQIPENIQKEFKVFKLVEGYRLRGHLFTKTNPVRDRRSYTPTLDLENFGLTNNDLDIAFSAGEVLGIGVQPLRKIIEHLEKMYCNSIGVEYMYLRNPEVISWWQSKLNVNDNQPNFTPEKKKYILSKLNQAVNFEHFLQTKYVGQKRFSLEGGESLIPAISNVLFYAVEKYELKECVLGMAHRGRLNTLVNIFRKPLNELFSEFDGKDFEDAHIDGDVKYHLGLTLNKTYQNGKNIKMNLVPNPSHLETVASVAEGITRAKIDNDYNGDDSKILPIVVHGDAAIAGQGIVYEVAQMSKLNGYKTGGTLHIVVNNQIGFTTNYLDARSSTYCTDVAKVTLSPVLHVNSDDAEAVVHAIELALDYRMRYKKDVYIDLLGYRKYGHNEGDEPSFTQPKLYKAIAKHKNPFELYTNKLLAENTIDTAYQQNIVAEFKKTLEAEYDISRNAKSSKVRQFMQERWQGFERTEVEGMLAPAKTNYPDAKLKSISKVMSTVPEGVKFVTKAARILEGRAQMVFETDNLDWGMGEMLAYGSLLEEGFNVRMSGQDVERGTFSHRHAILRDEISEERINLLNNNPNNKGHFYIYNSLLSEYGVLGFEYGYAMANPNTLTIWEAQFGDFSNGAQIIFDQYLSAAEDKWKTQNGIVVLLPHGYEGQGSEHSSARIERYLQLCGNDNMYIANCTTPANFFHILRRQMKRNFRKPLVVFTPKSLLRHPKAVSSIKALASGEFQEVIDDTVPAKNVKKVVFCSGKFYYDLLAARETLNRNDVALVRIEQLFPLHTDKIQAILKKYPKGIPYIWAQEEPKNMGAWTHIAQRLEGIAITCVSRPYNSVPAPGSSTRDKARQQRVINTVFDIN